MVESFLKEWNICNLAYIMRYCEPCTPQEVVLFNGPIRYSANDGHAERDVATFSAGG
jgi:hypothetical protein